MEEDATMFPTLILESDSSGDDPSILSDPTYFMDKLVPTRVPRRTAKDDEAMAQLSQEETKIGKIPPLKVSSSKYRTASRKSIPRETMETRRKGPSRVSVTRNNLVYNDIIRADGRLNNPKKTGRV